MSENKRFKSFRSELTESEYKEVLTGYPNRGIDTDVGPVKYDQSMLMKVNAVLNALNRYSYQHPNEAFIKIKTRLNVFMLDFPWTPYLWNNGGMGNVALTVTRYGRVDGVDAITGEIRTDGKANNPDGFMEFTLSVQMETGEDGLYRMTAKLMPKADVLPEGVEENGEAIEEMAQTAARESEMKRKIEKHEAKAQSGYKARMTKTGKAAARGSKQEDKHDAASVRLLKRDRKEQESPYLYGRGGKMVKRKGKPVKEEVEQIDELSAKTKRSYYKKSVQSSNKMRDELDGVRDEQESKAQDFARSSEGQMSVDAARANVRHLPGGDKLTAREAELKKKIKQRERGQQQAQKAVKEGAEQIDELSKATKDAYVAKRGSQLSSMLSGHTRGKQLTGKQQANAVKGIKRATGVSEELVGGQKRLDVNKNKRLDAQDFAMLRNKKKPMKEYLDMASGMALQSPAPGDAVADKSGKGKRFHKKALKMVDEAMAKARKPKQKTPQKSDRSGAAGVIGRQSAIKHTLAKHDMRW